MRQVVAVVKQSPLLPLVVEICTALLPKIRRQDDEKNKFNHLVRERNGKNELKNNINRYHVELPVKVQRLDGDAEEVKCLYYGRKRNTKKCEMGGRI